MAACGDKTADDGGLTDELLVCERYGWTLEYIDVLSWGKYKDILVATGAIDAARSHLERQARKVG